MGIIDYVGQGITALNSNRLRSLYAFYHIHYFIILSIDKMICPLSLTFDDRHEPLQFMHDPLDPVDLDPVQVLPPFDLVPH